MRNINLLSKPGWKDVLYMYINKSGILSSLHIYYTKFITDKEPLRRRIIVIIIITMMMMMGMGVSI